MAPILTRVIHGFTQTWQWLVKNKGVVIPLTAAVLGLAAAIKVASMTSTLVTGLRRVQVAIIGEAAAANLAGGANLRMRASVFAAAIAMRASAVATRVAAAATWLFNIAMRANPIMLVVTAIAALAAGFVLAYKKLKWFRDGVNAAWQFIKGAAGLFYSAGKGIAMALFHGIKWIGGKVLGFLKSVIQPAIDAFNTAMNLVSGGAPSIASGTSPVAGAITAAGNAGFGAAGTGGSGITTRSLGFPGHRAFGGFIPGGYGGGDRVQMMTEPGEFVVRKEAVRALGRQAMLQINQGRGGGGGGPTVIEHHEHHIYLDKREFALAVGEHTADRAARA